MTTSNPHQQAVQALVDALGQNDRALLIILADTVQRAIHVHGDVGALAMCVAYTGFINELSAQPEKSTTISAILAAHDVVAS